MNKKVNLNKMNKKNALCILFVVLPVILTMIIFNFYN